MMKSLYSGVAGMKTHNQRMDVIGNNISNVNTTGYKASEVTFKDVYYQTKRNSSSGDATSGGKNPTQIGYGSQLNSVTQIMTQSGFTYSDSVYNCALEGEGFFQVMDHTGNVFYTRAGKFSVDSYGNLTDPSGNIVLGVNGDPTGIDQGQSQRIKLTVPPVEDNRASSTKTINGFDVTFTAAAPGDQGNISFSIINSDTPFATKTGSSLTVYMDLDKEYGTEAFKDYTFDSLALILDDQPFLDQSVGVRTIGQIIVAAANKSDLAPDAGFTEANGVLEAMNNTDYSLEDRRALSEMVYREISDYVDTYVSTGFKIEGAAEGEEQYLKASQDDIDAITRLRTTYTEEALADFNDQFNTAIELGGVGFEEGVIPIDIEFSSLPSFSDVQAIKATNTFQFIEKDESGNVRYSDTLIDAEHPELGYIPIHTNITFTADVAGEAQNKLEVDLKYSSAIGGKPVAKWKGDVLTITLPDKTNIDDIQEAIDNAAKDKGNDNYKITVTAESMVRNVARADDGTETVTYGASENVAGMDFSTLIGARTERLGLDGGRNNFFTDLATAMSTVALTDGRLAAEQAVDDLETIQIDSDGIIYGRHAVHGMLLLGRIDIATFENPMGLEQVGTTLWRASLASGEPQIKIPGQEGSGEVVQNALEMSNVDLAQEFSDMIITQRGYQANSRVITVTDTMLEELINLKR